MSCLFALYSHDGWVKSVVIKDKTLYSGSFDSHIKVSKRIFPNGNLQYFLF